MNRLALFPLLLTAGCHVRPESLVPAGVPSAPRQSEYLLDRSAAFAVLGDGSSFVWPALLQELLDAHARKPEFYRVRNAATGTPGIDAWVQATRDGALPALLGAQEGAALPKTVLCQVSLRGLGGANGPVKTENDMVGAEMGADALERLALELSRRGVEHVIFATPVYDPRAGEELGLERVAIERLLARGHEFVAAGPDLFRATRRYHPDAYEADRVHLNEFGLKLIAEEWYRWLAGPAAHESVVEALYAKDYDVEALEAAFAKSRGLPRP